MTCRKDQKFKRQAGCGSKNSLRRARNARNGKGQGKRNRRKGD